jgi:hypothetical protein
VISIAFARAERLNVVPFAHQFQPFHHQRFAVIPNMQNFSSLRTMIVAKSGVAPKLVVSEIEFFSPTLPQHLQNYSHYFLTNNTLFGAYHNFLHSFV